MRHLLSRCFSSGFDFLVYVVLITSLLSVAKGEDLVDTSAQASIRDYLFQPTVVNSYGIVGSDLSSLLDAGISARIVRTKDLRLELTASAGVFRIPDTSLIGWLMAKGAFEYKLVNASELGYLSVCAAVSTGFIASDQDRMTLAVSGLKAVIELGTPSWRSKLPVDVVAVVGYGYDFHNTNQRELVNVGLQLSDLIFISFDVSSLWKDMDPLLNVARF